MQSKKVFLNMSFHRFFCPEILSQKAIIIGSEAKHIRVMRLNPGDQVQLVDGLGKLADAVIEKIGKNEVSLTVQNIQTQQSGKNGKLAIAVSVAKGDRFEWLIAKCTELGADWIIPTIYERTVKLAKGAKAADRWHSIAVSSMKQCGRLFLPAIDEPAALEQAIAKISAQKYKIALCTPEKKDLPLDKVDFSTENICGCIGPEGGMTDNEERLLMEKGAAMLCLNRNILRVETAAVAFCSIGRFYK